MVKVNGQAVLRMPHTPTIDIDQYTCSNTSCFRCLLTRAAFSLTPKSRSSNSVPRHEKIAVVHFNIGYIYLTNPRQTVDFCVLVGEVAIHGADMQLIAILTWFTGRLLIGLTPAMYVYLNLVLLCLTRSPTLQRSLITIIPPPRR